MSVSRDRKLNLAVIGLSLTHPYAFAPYLEERGHRITHVWDTDRDKAVEYAKEHNSVAMETPESGVGKVDAVINSSIISDHPRLATPYLKAGIAVFADKFLSPKLSETEEMVRVAKESGAVLMAASAIRFLPEFLELARIARSGEKGKPLAAFGNVHHSLSGYLQGLGMWQDNVEQCGGSLMNMGIHAMDPLLDAFGPDVIAVACTKSKRVYPQAQSEDQSAILMKYPDGLIAGINVICGVSGGKYTLDLVTTDTEIHAAPGPAPKNLYGPMLDAFVEGVYSGEWPIPAEQLVASVKVLSAARTAADTGCWVTL